VIDGGSDFTITGNHASGNWGGLGHPEYGVIGENAMIGNAGILGSNNGGVFGEASGSNQPGVRARSNKGDGVDGWTGDPNKSGVYGWSASGTGVTGRSEAVSGYGVEGRVTAANSRGVYANATGPNSVGVYGRSDHGTGVEGRTISSNEWIPAIYGRNAGAGDGVYGWSQGRHGTYGVTKSPDPNYAGVYGINHGAGPAVLADGYLEVKGDLNVNGRVKITDGSQGLGKVLTSDASGLAIWQTWTGGGNWSLFGNSGTTPGTHFLGTTDFQALELHVKNARALRLEPADNGHGFGGLGYSPNVIGGLSDNSVTSGVVGATISGGGREFSEWHQSGPWPNRVTEHFGTVGGGYDNEANGVGATVCGGVSNVANGVCATVGGGGWWYVGPGMAGGTNLANRHWSTVGGGGGNTAYDMGTTVSGGLGNLAWDRNSTVGGGSDNAAESSGTTIGGGQANLVRSGYPSEPNKGLSTIGGGLNNRIYGNFSTIGGGEDNEVRGSWSTIGGGMWHNIYAHDSVIAGGLSNMIGRVWPMPKSEYSTIGGGSSNIIFGDRSIIGGGAANMIGSFEGDDADYSTIGGGRLNEILGNYSTIAGGGPSDPLNAYTRNVVVGHYGAIGGGGYNFAGTYGTVPGGRNNSAEEEYGFAAGYRAKSKHDGTFVWADSTDADFASTGDNQFLIRASGGVGIGTTNPAGQLDVNGAIYQRGNQLHADYVFEPDYELENIDEHSEFMWKEKHLPAIPKARIDDNGQEIVEVGSHRKGIVEELEKAHIYIEQLHKQNEALETRLVKLEAIVAQLNVSQKVEIVD
jgi:hypothetical protein